MDGCMAQGRGRQRSEDTPAARPYPRVTSFRSRRSTLSGGQQTDLGSAVARARHAGPGRRRACRGCWTPRPGSAGPRRWYWRSAAAPACRRWRWPGRTPPRRRRRRGVPPRPGQLLSAIDREGLTNIRLIRGDGVDVLEHMLGSRVADRRAGVLPRPVAQGAPPQAPAAAAVHRRADRRPAAARRGPARRDRSRRVRRADRRGRRRRTAAAPRRRRTDDAAHLGARGPTTKYETKAQHAGSAVTELLWEKCHEPHRRTSTRRASPRMLAAPPTTADSAPRPQRPAAGAAGVGRAQPRHGPRLDPRRPADRRAPAPLRRAGPLAAGPHRRTGSARPTTRRSRSSRRPRSSPTSRRVAPTSCGPGSRRCATWGSRSSPNRRSTTTATSTATCSTTSRCAAARGWPACWWPPPTGRRSG